MQDLKDLKFINDAELNQKIKNLVSDERNLLSEILLHIAEVDRRKLYLRWSYPSLFEYLVQEIGYSHGSAQRRIDAARLIQKLPGVNTKIEVGSINLSQISKMQKLCRQIKKDSGTAVAVSMQKNILEKLVDQGERKTDLILAQEFNVEIKTQDKIQIQRDESVRVEMVFSKEELELIKKAQELLSNKTGGKLKDTLLEMARKIIKTSEPKLGQNKAKKLESTPLLKTLTPRLKKEILHLDKCCQFKDPQTGKICGSKYFLSVDHIQPRFALGENTRDNLRILCRSHNIFRYQAGL